MILLTSGRIGTRTRARCGTEVSLEGERGTANKPVNVPQEPRSNVARGTVSTPAEFGVNSTPPVSSGFRLRKHQNQVVLGPEPCLRGRCLCYSYPGCPHRTHQSPLSRTRGGLASLPRHHPPRRGQSSVRFPVRLKNHWAVTRYLR